jgi:hypothetical protein
VHLLPAELSRPAAVAALPLDSGQQRRERASILTVPAGPGLPVRACRSGASGEMEDPVLNNLEPSEEGLFSSPSWFLGPFHAPTIHCLGILANALRRTVDGEFGV